jgi:hypothetical protein
MIRSDYVFSYWIFLWFILYILKIIKYSPKFIIILGIIENFFVIIYLILKKSTLYKITKFIIINIIIKVIPLYIIWKDEINLKDIIVSIILFVIYLIWIYINCGVECLYNIQKKIINSYGTMTKRVISKKKNYKNNTILSYLYDKFFIK